MEVIVLAIFPVQFPVELSVYVEFRFMKRPELTAMGLATLRVWTLAVTILALKMFAWVLTVRLVMLAVTRFPTRILDEV